MIFDAHEDTQEQIMDKTWIPRLLRKLVSATFNIYQKHNLKKYDALITVTPKIAEKLLHYNRNVHIVTNYPILTHPQQEAMGADKYLFFAGGISEQWCHESIIMAVNTFDGIRYKMAGIEDKKYLMKLQQTEGWDKVDYLGRIKHDSVEKIYSGAIAGMAVNECTQIREEGSLGNTKLFEIMAASIPVICTNYRLWKEIVENNHCGICVESNNIGQIANAIEYLVNNPQVAKTMGKNGRSAVEQKYNWTTQEKILFDLYENLAATLPNKHL